MTAVSHAESEVENLVADVRRDATRRAELEAALEETHPFYAGHGTPAVVRMRGWVIEALADVGLSDAALPFVLEELESGIRPYLTAAAARALSGTIPRPDFVAYLLKGLENMRYRDDAVSFANYGEYVSTGPLITARQEVIRAIGRLGEHGRDAVAPLESMREEFASLAPEIESALQAIPQAAPATCCCCSAQTTPAPPPHRDATVSPAEVAAIELQDHDGAVMTFAEFFHGHPSIVAFFYTRCENPQKCRLTVSKLAEAQRIIGERPIRTAAITYDPGYDLPARLHAYGETYGLRMNEDHRLLRTQGPLDPLQTYFELGVSRSGSLVTHHRIEAFVLDTKGVIVSSATHLQWEPRDLVETALRSSAHGD